LFQQTLYALVKKWNLQNISKKFESKVIISSITFRSSLQINISLQLNWHSSFQLIYIQQEYSTTREDCQWSTWPISKCLCAFLKKLKDVQGFQISVLVPIFCFHLHSETAGLNLGQSGRLNWRFSCCSDQTSLQDWSKFLACHQISKCISFDNQNWTIMPKR
jgi:hypothetical protein